MKRTGSTSAGTMALRSKRPPLFQRSFCSFRKDRIVEGEQRWHAIGSALGAVLLVVPVYRAEDSNDEEESIRIIPAREANKRERRIYLSLQPFVRVAPNISKPVSKSQKSVLSRIAKGQAAGDDSGIDYSEIPALTDEQLAQFKRAPKVLVAEPSTKRSTIGS